MSALTYRVVLIADQHDPSELVEKLIQAGLKPSDIHLSRDQASPELVARGVHFDVPSGVLSVQSLAQGQTPKRSSCGNCTCTTCWPADVRVP